MRKHGLTFITLITFTLTLAFLAPQRAAADQDDPPGRIARLSQADGSVSFEPAGTDDWVTAVVNRPMSTGDKLWADHDSRAELQLGAASIRLGANTGFSFLNLDDNTTQLQLTEGALRIRVKRLNRDEIFEVDTPNLAFSVLSPGIYRIDVNEAGDTTVVAVREGDAEVTGGGQTFSVHSGDAGTFTGTDQLNADIQSVGDQDDLDRWSYERDRNEDHSTSRRYVSDEAVGYEDLDQYGGWRDTPDYGTIWFPHVTVVGWAPYRYGHWVWIAPWGYTWVEDEPWGFAPFHYGRWVVVGGVWGWVPCRPSVVGVAYVRPVYAPALVAWVGGPHFAIGVAVGGGAAVGWFPLGPREVYVPSYHVSRTYVNNVNITNTTVNTTVVNNYYTNVVVNRNVTNVRYVNQTAPGAVTATSRETFASGQAVHNNIVRVDERQIASAPAGFSAPVTPPTKQAVLGAGRPATARPPAALANRAVVAKTAPPPPSATFERQQAAIQQNGGRPLAISQARQIQQEQPKAAVRMAPPARAVTQPPQNATNRTAPPQNAMRPAQEQSNVQQNNRPSAPPANADRPNNNALPPNANRPTTPPLNAQHNDRPPSARPSSSLPPNGNPQLEQQHQQELESMRKQQDQERQNLEQQQAKQRQLADQQKADAQAKQQLQQQHQQQLQDLEQKHGQQQQQVQQRQQQEHQQQRQQQPPRQQSQPQPKQQEKSKEKPPKS
jgi:Family of unknown function (DUF6600)